MTFRFHAYGHPALLSTHATTVEITKEHHLSHHGDCIVGVNSSKGLLDIPTGLKEILSNARGRVRVTLTTNPFHFVIEGRGDPRLTFSHPTDLVIRKSGFISDRTLMILADKAARDLPREMVRHLQNPDNSLIVEISAFIKE